MYVYCYSNCESCVIPFFTGEFDYKGDCKGLLIENVAGAKAISLSPQ